MGAFAMPEVGDDPYLRSQALLRLAPSTSEYLKSKFKSGFDEGPSMLKSRELDMYKAENEDSPTLTAEDATNKYGIQGQLTFDYPIKESEAKLLNSHKIDQISTMETLSHDHSRLTGLTGVGAEMAGNMVDPLNFALNFIPVVGEARYLKMASAIGKIPARFVSGTASGLVAFGAQEPEAHNVGNLYGENRTVGESIKNVLWGSAGAGVLHVGAGFLGDGINKLRGKADPVEIYRLQEAFKAQEAADAITHQEVLKNAADPRNMLADTHRGIAQGTLAQMERGELISAPSEVAALDRATVEQEVIGEMHKSGQWDDVIERGDHQLTAEEYARKYPEKVKPVTPLEKVPDLFSANELKAVAKEAGLNVKEVDGVNGASHEELVNTVSELQADLEIAKRTGKTEAEVLQLSKELDFYSKAVERSSERDRLLQQHERSINFSDNGKAKAVEAALKRGEPIPHETMLEHPNLIEKYPKEATESVGKFEERKAQFMEEMRNQVDNRLREKLQDFAKRGMMAPKSKMSDALVKSVEPLPAGEAPKVADANTEVDYGKELTSLEAANKDLIKEAEVGLTDVQKEALNNNEGVTNAKKMGEIYKLAAQCVANYLI